MQDALFRPDRQVGAHRENRFHLKPDRFPGRHAAWGATSLAGTCCEGNVTPAAEYNIWVDPEAARIVLRSGLPTELVGWHLSRGEAVLNANDIDKILRPDTPLARFAIDCNRTAKDAYFKQTGETGISLPDPVAMAVALDPMICVDASDHYVDVEVTSDLTRMTVVDRLGIAGNRGNSAIWSEVPQKGKPARICWVIDIGRRKGTLSRALESQ